MHEIKMRNRQKEMCDKNKLRKRFKGTMEGSNTINLFRFNSCSLVTLLPRRVQIFLNTGAPLIKWAAWMLLRRVYAEQTS